MTTTKLEQGKQYDLSTLQLIGWTEGDGSGSEGYTLADYFDADGTYRGADVCGIEPIVATTERSTDDYYLYDSDTGEMLLVDELGISAEAYAALVEESLDCGQPEGHIRPDALHGRRVYAAE